MDGLIDYLCDIISVPSVGGEETAAQRHVAAKMADIGLDVDAWNMDFNALKGHPALSMSVERKEGLGVVGSLGSGDDGHSLILNGHIDVVSPGDETRWRHPPWRGTVEDGRVYGRGAADMKGGLCCALFAVKAIVDAGVRLRGRLMVESVIGEEDGGVGVLDAVLRGYKADAAIIMEPSELAAVPAHAGVTAFRITIPGKAAHACIREEGVSAIDKFLIIYEALKELEAERNSKARNSLFARYRVPYPISVGRIEGGMWPGTVAESLSVDGRIGVAVGEDADHARRDLEEAVRRAAVSDPWLRENPPIVEWKWYRSDPSSIPVNHPIMKTLKTAYRDVTGTLPRVEGKTYSSDMRLLIKVGGIPTMIFGPGDIVQAHAADEFVAVSELERATKTLALTVLRFSGC
jgi:acetylornithine deacetylase